MKKKSSSVFSVRPDLSQTDEEKWRRYHETGDGEIRRQLILENVRLVHFAYGRMKNILPHGMEREDAIGYGIAGLIEAVDRYEVEKGRFATLAYLRIQGAIRDGICCFDWISRHDRRTLGLWRQCEEERGDEEFTWEVAERPGEKEYVERIRRAIYGGERVPLEQAWQVADERPEGRPEQRLLQRDQVEQIHRAIAELSPREQEVIHRYYFEGVTLKEIAADKRKSVSWISEIHRKALSKLREKIQKNS